MIEKWGGWSAPVAFLGVQANRDFGLLVAASLSDLGMCFAIPRLSDWRKHVHWEKEHLVKVQLDSWDRFLGFIRGFPTLTKVVSVCTRDPREWAGPRSGVGRSVVEGCGSDEGRGCLWSRTVVPSARTHQVYACASVRGVGM